MRRVGLIWMGLAAVLLVGPLIAMASTGSEDAPKGKLVLTADAWQAVLYPAPSGKALSLTGGKDAVEVPAGKYRVRYTLSGSKDPKVKGAMVIGSPADAITIEADKTTTVKIGTPLEATIKVEVKEKQVSFSATFADAGGNTAIVYAAPVNGTQVTPKIDVVDKDGKTVYTATMKFG